MEVKKSLLEANSRNVILHIDKEALIANFAEKINAMNKGDVVGEGIGQCIGVLSLRAAWSVSV